jgi:hypothetical protein
MIKITSRQILYDLPFEQYLEIDAISNSTMKSEGREFRMTEKIAMGKEVDEILTNPEHQSTNIEAKKIASMLTTTFGDVIKLATNQVSIICDVEGFDLTAKVKTRPDFFFDEMLSIDLKVTYESLRNIDNLIDFMKYHEQCYFHRTLGGVQDSYLMIWSVKDMRGRLLKSEKDCAYWLEKAILGWGK